MVEQRGENNLILQNFDEENLGRNMFLMSVPLLTAFLAYYRDPMPWHGCLAILLVSFGSALVWTGLLLKRFYRRVSMAFELGGVSLLLLSFFGYLASHLPWGLLWVPVISYLLCITPIVAAAAFCFRAPIALDMAYLQ